MAHRSGIEHTLLFLWCSPLSFTSDFSPLYGHCMFRPFLIVSLYDTKIPYPRVIGWRHIASSVVERVSVIFGFSDQCCSGMIS